jgi:hypothetical protein
MTTRPSGALISPATKVVLKALIYYAVLIAVGAYIWQAMPETAIAGQYSIDAILGRPAAADPAAPDPTGTLAASAAVAMIAAVLLAIPVAWVYQLTRAKEGYQQSVVQLLIILPIVVAGIVVLVKFSLALAFSLAGIVAAVRFRNALDDSKDAVYVFLAIGWRWRSRSSTTPPSSSSGTSTSATRRWSSKGGSPSVGWSGRASWHAPGRSWRASTTRYCET